MLPRSLAGISFVDSALGADAALAARAADAVRRGRMGLLGSGRPGLVRALLARGLDVVVIDSSRTALRAARADLGPDSPAELLVADPRELEIPGGLDGLLLPSAALRAITLADDRRQVLRSAAQELRCGGRLLLDLERVPPAPEHWEPLPSGFPGARWRRGAAEGTFDVSTCSGDGEERGEGEEIVVSFAGLAPEEAVREALAAGFRAADVQESSAGTGEVLLASLETSA